MPEPTPEPIAEENSIVETLQSLIVAFVLAMTFRGFVTEGFVIPTGSMAPTLLGQHKQLRGTETGWPFPAGADQRGREVDLERAVDPMLGPQYPGSGTSRPRERTRMGDRILVLKSLYPFQAPSRFDVVVFKNPTNPNGDDGNYIKRLIGLPNESIWLADGDVFAGSADAPRDFASYAIQRKPEHVQRAVWQPVYHSDYYPLHPERLDVTYRGAPWSGEGWVTDGRPSFRCEAAAPSRLEWDNHVRTLDDWAAYNVFVQRLGQPAVFVNDVRVAATVVPDQDGLEMTFDLEARTERFQFIIADGTARIRMRSGAYDDDFPDQGWAGPDAVPVAAFAAGRPTRVEFWHVDQCLWMFVDGECVARHPYDWDPVQRLQQVTGRSDDDIDAIASLGPGSPPSLRLEFSGSPVTLHHVEVDRDLYYQTDHLNEFTRKNPSDPRYDDVVRGQFYAFGTHPQNLAILGPDHFFMCGDNSAASSDSRLWGSPHPLVATQIDPAPFVVNRKLLLGKAWVVYFPSPHSITDGGSAIIPDFGRLRFIR